MTKTSIATEYAQKLGIAEAALTVIAILAEASTTDTAHTLLDIRDTARKALNKTRGPEI